MYSKGFRVSDLSNVIDESLKELDNFNLYDEYDYLMNADSNVLKRCADAIMGVCSGDSGGAGNLNKLRTYLNTVSDICPSLQEYQDNIIEIEKLESARSTVLNRLDSLNYRQEQYEPYSEDWDSFRNSIRQAEDNLENCQKRLDELYNRQEQIKTWVDGKLNT